MSTPQEESAGSHLADSLYSILEKEAESAEPGEDQGEVEEVTNIAGVLEFHDNRGRNVSLCHGNTMARRSDSYNQGLVISAKPLPRDTLFQVKTSLHITVASHVEEENITSLSQEYHPQDQIPCPSPQT